MSCETTTAKAGVSGLFLSRHQIKVSPTCIDNPGTATDLLHLKAASALQAMNGIVLGSKQLVVHLHEPRQLCQEKLAHRFGSGSGGHPRMCSGSGAMSPTLSEGGESYWGRSSPGGPALPGGQGDRVCWSSGSYYTVSVFLSWCFMRR